MVQAEKTEEAEREIAAGEGSCPILSARFNVEWLTLEAACVTDLFPVNQEGILRDVFNQRASMACCPASIGRITLSLLLPGRLAPIFFNASCLGAKGSWAGRPSVSEGQPKRRQNKLNKQATLQVLWPKQRSKSELKTSREELRPRPLRSASSGICGPCKWL